MVPTAMMPTAKVPTALLLLADGRFPGGSSAHSGGLEAAVADGSVADLAGLESFLRGRLLTTARVDAWLAAAACSGEDPLALDVEADARCPSPVLRAVSRALGRGLRRAAAAGWPMLADLAAEHHPVVQGVVARAAGLSVPEAAALPGASLLAGVASAAARLLPIDMADAMAVATRLSPLADEAAAQGACSAAGPRAAGPAWSAPLWELRAERHARWEVRLFAS